jgi:hypothetical protein
MPSPHPSQPEEVTPPPLVDLACSLPAPRQGPEVKAPAGLSSADQSTPNLSTADLGTARSPRIRDGWSLLDVLLESPAKTRTFLGLFAFGLVTAAVVGGLTIGILLLVLPHTSLESNWLWPIGAGGTANLVLLVRAWFMIRGSKESPPDGDPRDPRSPDPRDT